MVLSGQIFNSEYPKYVALRTFRSFLFSPLECKREGEWGKQGKVKQRRGGKRRGPRWVEVEEESLSGRRWNLPFDIVKCKRTYAALWRICKSQHCDH